MDLAEVALVEDDEEVEACTPHAARESLADSVGLGGLTGSGQNVDVGPLSDSVECRAELVVVASMLPAGFFVSDVRRWGRIDG